MSIRQVTRLIAVLGLCGLSACAYSGGGTGVGGIGGTDHVGD